MPYQLSRKDEFVHILWQGELTNEDLVSLGQEMPKLAATLGYAPHVLHTFEEISSARMEPWSVFQHSQRHRDITLKNRARSAWVSRTPEVRQMGRLFQELNRNPQFEIRLFDDEALALAWLRSKPVRKTRSRSRAATD